jgi:dTMP kinase
MDMQLVKNMDQAATGGLTPDLTILLDVDVETGLERAGAHHSGDRMEKRSREFHEKVRDGYLTIARENPERITVISVNEDIEETYSALKDRIYGFIEGCKGTK